MLPALAAGAAAAQPTPTYVKTHVLVARDQFRIGAPGVQPAYVFKPHETANAPGWWVVSNERAGKAGIGIFRNGTNRLISHLNIEHKCIRVVQLNGRLGACAPPSTEGARHPHGIAIDLRRKLIYQVIEHSGLQWLPNRRGFKRATHSDTESGLLVVYSIANLAHPRLLRGYVLGHAAEEDAVNPRNGKVYAGNHEPSPTVVPCFVSVVDARRIHHPYGFINLPSARDCVQGVDVDKQLNTVNGTTHIGQKMFTFSSRHNRILYCVNLRAPFDRYIARLPRGQRFKIPPGWVLHMHDLTTDSLHHIAYQTLHTIASPVEAEEPDATRVPARGSALPEEFTGRWVLAVNTNPASPRFKKVTVIDLSNGQYVPRFPTAESTFGKTPYSHRFVHAHFVAVDPFLHVLLVTGEHTGNLGVVDTRTDKLVQVISISKRIPGCKTKGPLEPHVHGVSIDEITGTAYVSDEAEECTYESVTILEPR